MNKTMRMIWCLIVVLFSATTVLAQTGKGVYSIIVPDKLGKVKERYVGQTESVVVHIQDAHASVEAQQNIAHIIEFMIRKDDLNVVGTEGATGPVNMDYYRGLPFKDVVKDTAFTFVKDGFFTGGEYALIVSSKAFDFNGIEDEEIMFTNYRAYLEAVNMREDALREFAAIDAAVLTLEQNSANEDLKAFLGVYENYEDKILDFIDYSGEVITKAQELEIQLLDYVQLSQYVEYVEKKDAIDLDKLETEKEELLGIFEKRAGELDEDPHYIKLQKALSGENKLFTGKEMEELIIAVARKFSVPEEQYANLKTNVEVERRFQLFNIGELLREADELTYVVLDKLAQNSNEKKLLEIRRAVKGILKMISLEALKHDTLYFNAHRATYDINSWYAFLEGEAQKIGKDLELQKGLVDYTRLFDACGTYYEAAMERDIVLAKNMVKLMNEKGVSISAMICGGYHTQGITETLREMGQSYVVIMPRITTAAEDLPLEDRLTGKIFGVDMLEVLNERKVAKASGSN
ncbi:MAG: hypothetical protein JW938_05030 [Candidatus Omnitrophica bacterium]|nr:hypothetical protein [Candidatus Omnitrophota bacterium]